MSHQSKTEEREPVGSSELLACPFCGGVATMEEIAGMLGVRKSAGCNTEGCMGYQSNATFATYREATKAWNTRQANDKLTDAGLKRSDL